MTRFSASGLQQNIPSEFREQLIAQTVESTGALVHDAPHLRQN
jgi:hypothetical protein